MALTGWIVRSGAITLHHLARLGRFSAFLADCLSGMTQRATYNSAVRDVLEKTVGFTLIRPLRFLLVLSALVGAGGVWLVVTLSATFGFSDYAAQIIGDVMIEQAPPLFAALFIAMRASPVNNTEIALMTVRNQVAALSALRIDPVGYLCVPRLAGSVISALAVAVMLVMMVFAGNELFSWLSARLDYPYYAQDLARTVAFGGVFGMALKTVLLAFFVTVVPLYHGLHPVAGDNPLPATVLRGMDNVLLAIILIEGASLIVN